MIVFVPGFFGVSETGDITTFGRGGSDYSAAVVAAAMDAEILEVWKDVPGYMSADPRFVPEARLIPFLSYDEAAELSYFGAKILHPRTIEPLRKMKLNIAVKNTLNPDETGSLITSRSPRATPSPARKGRSKPPSADRTSVHGDVPDPLQRSRGESRQHASLR